MKSHLGCFLKSLSNCFIAYNQQPQTPGDTSTRLYDTHKPQEILQLDYTIYTNPRRYFN